MFLKKFITLTTAPYTDSIFLFVDSVKLFLTFQLIQCIGMPLKGYCFCKYSSDQVQVCLISGSQAICNEYN